MSGFCVLLLMMSNHDTVNYTQGIKRKEPFSEKIYQLNQIISFASLSARNFFLSAFGLKKLFHQCSTFGFQ